MANILNVDDEMKGKRADVLVTSLFPTISRAYIHKLFEAGKVLINDVPGKPGYKLRLNDRIETEFELRDLGKIPDIDLPIIYQDDDVLVIDKPTGVISHARGKFWDEASVASFVRQITGQEGERAGIVHRLDRATSGVMICAKNQPTLSWIQKQFSQRSVKKTYVAIVEGHIDPPEAVIDMPIERNPKIPATFRVGANGKPAITTYKLIDSSKHYDMLELYPKTGRTHQLRVHLKQIGHPILGDKLYGNTDMKRLYLHADTLELTLPGGERKIFKAPLPSEFNKIFKQDK